MAYLRSAAKLILLIPIGRGDGLPANSITAVPSQNNYIIYEKDATGEFSSNLALKIQSDIPLTIQRYDKDYSSTNGFTHPINEGDGIILITSTCDTDFTSIVPTVDIQKEELATFVKIELGIPEDEAANLPFLDSSSYNATWYESGCGWFPGPPSPAPNDVAAIESNTCLTEAECDNMRQKLGLNTFLAGDFKTKGCFSKNGNGCKFFMHTEIAYLKWYFVSLTLSNIVTFMHTFNNFPLRRLGPGRFYRADVQY